MQLKSQLLRRGDSELELGPKEGGGASAMGCSHPNPEGRCPFLEEQRLVPCEGQGFPSTLLLAHGGPGLQVEGAERQPCLF